MRLTQMNKVRKYLQGRTGAIHYKQPRMYKKMKLTDEEIRNLLESSDNEFSGELSESSSNETEDVVMEIPDQVVSDSSELDESEQDIQPTRRRPRPKEQIHQLEKDMVVPSSMIWKRSPYVNQRRRSVANVMRTPKGAKPGIKPDTPEDEIDDSLSSDEDENDVEGVASNPAAVPYPKDSEWTAVDTYRPLPVNTTPRQILVDIDESSSVLDCSKVFLTDSDVNELKRQTNLYASQTIQKKRRGNNLKPHSVLSSWKPVTISEMRRFLGIIFHMCVSKKPKIADHWSTNPVLSCNFCPHVMSRLRFTQILSCLHLVDNSNQKKPGEDGFHPLYKVLPYYNNLKERCIQAYRPSEKVTIDEGICPFRGRVSFRVYMQNKPHKYGLKVYAVAEASSGYVVNFEVYAGKHIVDNSSSAVILRLLSDSSLLNKGHTVYLDRFYSSPELFQQLAEKGTGAVGTVNKSRKGLPKDLVSAKLKKGEMSFRRKDNVLAMKWKDKRDVYTLSTRHQATFGTHTKRNGSVVLKPLQVLDYNLNKIGVDIGDQRLQYNPFQHRTVKWWRKLYFHLLLMGVSNAFWLYNAVHRKKITITDFITVLAVQLVEDDTLEFIPRNEGTVGRLTKRHFLQHIPATTKKYAARVCHVCSSRSKKQSGKASRKETRYECEQCGVALCLEPCFKIFHTKKQYDSV
ncbi:piggyBac transposable element-derived protein 4-like [Schistocerca serialis cubense]|uniref:piggyBac transposable element-derived protein 4-like n=1 Tax=Schistocerca serialis cubense TaxID=2023355 RepID=UPI00214EB5A0|nr:piggyBac transposable element-derived protein 4-like [Schistocerca serialis cubense]